MAKGIAVANGRSNGTATIEATDTPEVRPKAAKAEKPIELVKLKIEMIRLTLAGDSSLICNQWSEKAKGQMRDKQQKRAKSAKEAKDPQKDFEGSLYRLPEGGYGFPAVAFKAAAVDACSHIDGVTKVQARGAFHLNAEMVKIDGTPVMREDMVRVGMGVADIRYRGEFNEWSATFVLRYNANVLSADQIVNLFNTAGFAIGVGEWRPQRDGSHGMFHVL